MNERDCVKEYLPKALMDHQSRCGEFTWDESNSHIVCSKCGTIFRKGATIEIETEGFYVELF